MLSALCALAMSATAAVPVFAGTGQSAGAADGGVVKGLFEDFEGCEVGTITDWTNLKNITHNNEASYAIVADGDNKVMKFSDNYFVSGGNRGLIGMTDTSFLSSVADADYWVIKFDFKNGDNSSNAFPYLGLHNEEYRFDDRYITWGSNVNFTAYDWHQLMLIGSPKTSKMRLVLDGVDYGEQASTRISDANTFFYPFVADYGTSYSSDAEYAIYIDDMEAYGIKNVNRASTVKLTADAEKGKVYAEFDYPVSGFTAANVTVDNGASVSDVELSGGKYVISLSGVSYGSTYNVTVSGVTDVFGTAVTSASTSFVGAGSINDGVVGLVEQDFESYDVGHIFTSDDGNTKFYTGADRIYEIVTENGSKVLKMTRKANATGDTGVNLHPTSLMNETIAADYWVVEFDVKNGDSNAQGYPNISIFANYRLDEDGINFGSWIKYAKYDWKHLMFIGDKTTEKVKLVLDGKYQGEESMSRMSNANEFFYVQIFNTETKTHDSVAYIDNMAAYGVKKAGRQNAAKLVADNANAKLYATFTSPVKNVTASDVSVTGATVDSVTYDSTNDRWEIALSGYKSNTDYDVTLNGVEDVFGTTTMSATAKITTPRVQMKKTYLTTTENGKSCFLGTEDFEGYNKTGVIYGAAADTITRKSDSVDITRVWSGGRGTNERFEVTLAEEGTSNHAYKVTALSDVKKNDCWTLFQVKPDTNWTEKAQGKYFVYEVKFKSGDTAKNEAAFSSSQLTADGMTAQLMWQDGSVNLQAGGSGTVQNAFKVKEWNTLQYVIDYSMDKPKAYLLINGRLIAAMSKDSIAAANSQPRILNAYSDGTAGATLYLDDVSIYTIEPMKITDVTIGTDNVKVNVVTGYENSESDTVAADLWVAVYNTETGALVSVAKAADKILYGDNEYTANVTVNAGQTVKAFIWGGVNALTPLCSYVSK